MDVLAGLHLSQLWLFFIILLGVIVLPGLDMAFVMASSLVDGRRSGLCAVAGIVAGGACHTAMGALGVGVVLKLFPAAFNALLVAGVLYIAWIGWGLLRSASAFDGAVKTASRPLPATFGRAMLTCLMNPKAYVFMLAVFPQFVRPEGGPVWQQAGLLGLIIALTQAAVYGAVPLGAGGARRWLEGSPAGNLVLARSVGGVLVLAAAWTALEGWRAL
ncbi:LysE family translocator [Variovorax terrae]|uniref:LysE family translocator n=1 Tax=Variovorax terrae TaxID=2923278 RepID=A0A9X1VW99_9BURK|nr:LysE family translocator [Variovorax terrae]MCJ0761783.1 LysE family translocator [Variovorax terrae]